MGRDSLRDADADAAKKSQQCWAPLLAALGLMADVYDFTIINLVRPLLEQNHGKMTPAQDSFVTGAAIFGAIIGQLVFGAIADAYGRRWVFITTVAMIAVASLGSALAEPIAAFGWDIYTVLTFWRLIMGIGIGGEYNVSSLLEVRHFPFSRSLFA
eukprot:TRINITY_DN33963_c0_g1_i3.p1 TRINITY_DN33963_c0_g1~~TRINITY_DN33963_c0_g1_i3.p1  ORF type:complete len:156 (+),score=23.34 TRINITY_DN33963_c0_g1_i3:172-639(+)